MARTQTTIELVIAPAGTGMLGSLRMQQAELLDQIRTMEERIAGARQADAALAAIVVGDGDSLERGRAQAERSGLAQIIRQDQDKLAGIQARYDALEPSRRQLEEERGRLLTHQAEHKQRLDKWTAFEARLTPIHAELQAAEQDFRRQFPETCERLAQARILIHATLGEQDQRRGVLADIVRRLDAIGG